MRTARILVGISLVLMAEGGPLEAQAGLCIVPVTGDVGTNVNNCVNSLPLGGGIIQLPADSAGGRRYSTPIVIDKHNVTLRGYGNAGGGQAPGATTLVFVDSNATDTVAITVAAHNVTFERFVLGKATGAGNTAAKIGILVANGSDYTTLSDVTIFPDAPFTEAGLRAHSALGAATWILLRRCWVVAAAPIGADFGNANLVLSDGSAFNYNTINVRVGGVAKVTSFYFISGSAAHLGSAQGTSAVSIALDTVENAVIQDSYFETADDTTSLGQLAVKVSGGASNVAISGNYFQGSANTNYALEVGSQTPISVVNNTFYRYLVSAADVQSASRLVAYNNVLVDTPSFAALGSPGLHLDPDVDQAYFGNSGRRWLANLYAANFFRSQGDPAAPDLVGDGTHDLVIGGKADGSGAVRLGATTTLIARRIRMSNGTALTPASFSLSAGWGTGSTVAAVTGTDAAFQVTVKAGDSGFQSNPTVQLAFADGSWASKPIFTCSMTAGGSGTVVLVPADASVTALTITYKAMPAALKTYAINCLGSGT